MSVESTKTFKGFLSFKQADICNVSLPCDCLHKEYQVCLIKSLWLYCICKHGLLLWVYHHRKKMSWGVFPSCFLSSSRSSFSIQCHIHLPPIVLPVKRCIGIVSVFLYPLLQLTVIIKFLLQGKKKIFYSCGDDTWFHFTQTIQRTPLPGFYLLLSSGHKLCAYTNHQQQKSKPKGQNILH